MFTNKKMKLSFLAITLLSCVNGFNVQAGEGQTLSLQALVDGANNNVMQALSLKDGMSWAGAGLDVSAAAGGAFVGLSLAKRLGFEPQGQAACGVGLACAGLVASQGAQWYMNSLGRTVSQIAQNQAALLAAMHYRFDVVDGNLQQLSAAIIAAQQDNRVEHDQTRVAISHMFDALQNNLRILHPTLQQTGSIGSVNRGEIVSPSIQMGATTQFRTAKESHLRTYLPGVTVGVGISGVVAYCLFKSGLLGNN